MSDIENPSAFPKGGDYRLGHNGMTLRDYFAGQVLSGLPFRQWKVGHGTDGVIEAWATCAYAVADAMLAERAKKEGK